MKKTIVDTLHGLPSLALDALKNVAAKKFMAALLANGKVREFNAFRVLYPEYTDLSKLRFPCAQLRYVNLAGMDLRGTNFYGADLFGAKLAAALTTNCRFDRANLGALESWTVGNFRLPNMFLESAMLDEATLDPTVLKEVSTARQNAAQHGHANN